MGPDIRYALRAMLRAPGFAAAAILTLALGIGATTAIFSVADAVLLRPLPYLESDRLVLVWDQLLKLGLTQISPEYRTADVYRAQDRIFAATAGFLALNRILTGDGGAERVPAMLVTEQLFPMLGARTIVGRLFTPGEYRVNAELTAILSRTLYIRRFGGDPTIIGKSIRLDGRSYRVVGVMDPAFQFSLGADAVDIWTAISLDAPKSWGNATRMIARLRPGVKIEAAQSALSAVAKHVNDELHPYNGPHGEDPDFHVQVISLHEQLLGNFRKTTLLLLCAVAALLLIACVNVANLLLARAVAREKEISVRRALGATDWRLMKQWMIESSILALAGGILGSIAAVWGVKLLVLLSPSSLPGAARIGIDARALWFALAISALVCIAFGLAPSIASRKMSWGARGISRSRRRAASALVMAEVALAVLLLVSAGLLMKSFWRLRHVNPGFEPSHLLTMQVQFPPTRPISNVRSREFYSELREKLSVLPGVIDATLGGLPVRGGTNPGGGDPFTIKGRPYNSSGPVWQFANLNVVGLDYFRTFRIPLRAGRSFEARDSSSDAPRVVLVNETLARTFFPGGAVGQEIGVPKPCFDLTCDFDWATIIGVAGDVKTIALNRPTLPMIYMPHSQSPFPSAPMILRTAGDPMLLAKQAAQIVRSMDPDMPVFDVRTMEDRVSASIGEPRFETSLVGFFAAAALFLAGVGIFGVVAHSTSQRTQEMGIRMALGADRTDVMRVVMIDGMKPVLAGVALGLILAITASRLLESILFQVASRDPLMLGIGAIALTSIAALACLEPARRATHVDPVVALRAE